MLASLKAFLKSSYIGASYESVSVAFLVRRMCHDVMALILVTWGAQTCDVLALAPVRSDDRVQVLMENETLTGS